MPGILEGLFGRAQEAIEQMPVHLEPGLLNAQQQAENHAVNIAPDNFALQAQPGQVVHFGGEVPRDPVRQVEFFRYEAEAPQPQPPAYVQHARNGGLNYQPPWEIRQQIYPQTIETRLSADDVEKIAQRVLILIEEREAE